MIRAFTLACLTVLAATAPAAGDIPADARALIEKHVQWLGGWTALDRLQDLSLEGTLKVSGLQGSISVRARRDGRQRTEYDLKVIKGVECLAGDSGWERNASGQIEDMGLDKVRQQRRALDRTFNRHLRGEGVTVTAAGTMDKDGRAWSVLRFDYPQGDRYELLVDAATGESRWTREVEDGRESWTLADDIREVDGIRQAMRQETLHEQAAENQTVTWTSIRVNAGLADGLFDRPGTGDGIARLAAGRTISEWLPFELFGERYIYMRGKVNGIDTDILLDSGAGMTVLDRAFAESAGLHAEGAIAARGTGGVSEAGMVEGVTLQVGDLTIGPLTAAVIDLADVARRIGRSMPVILGKEVFHAMVVDIDYPGSRIRFHDPQSFTYEGPGHRLELQAGEDGHKNLQLSMEGGDPVTVGLDTGQGGALTVFGYYAEQRGFLTGRPLSEAKGGGVGGVVISKLGSLATVSLAGYTLHDVPVTFHQENVKGAFDTKRQAGNLGAGILNRFRVLFDYAHSCLWLEPGPDFAAPLPRDRTGLQLQRTDSTLTVVFVTPGSPAAAAGWREGEQVVALDGEAVGPNWWRTLARWSRAADGTVVRLTLAGGAERTLELRRYY